MLSIGYGGPGERISSDLGVDLLMIISGFEIRQRIEGVGCNQLAKTCREPPCIEVVHGTAIDAASSLWYKYGFCPADN